MGSNGSFYQNGLPLSMGETGLGNVAPGAPAAKANGSFYLSGSAYTTLMNSDALLAAITAQQVLATNEASVSTTQAGNASTSATNAAASAAAASATLASALKSTNNLSDLGSFATALVNLGLNNVNNTSDANKPVSTAQATADALVASNAATATALKANIASPAFTGVPTTAATPAALDNSLKLATTAYADAATAALSGTVTTALALKAPLASPSLTGVPVAPTAAALNNSTQLATTAYADAAVGVEKTRALAAEVLPGYVYGLTLSTAGSSSTFSVGAGGATDSTALSLMNLTPSINKTTGAFVAGTGNGALDTGTIAASAWYHVYLIKSVSTVDVLISASATAPTLPGGYTYFRRIGSMKTNGSSQWTKFIQVGNDFLWDAAVSDVTSSTIGTSNVTYTLTVPTGVSVKASLRVAFSQSGTNAAVLISSPLTTTQISQTPIGNSIAFSASGAYQDTSTDIWTNTAAQVNASSSAATGNTLIIVTYGWTDTLGSR